MPRARHAVRLEHGFHARLVAKVEGNLGSHARDTEGITDLAERDLQLLERAEQSVDAAEVPRHQPGCVGHLLWVDAVGHAVMPRECSPKVVAKHVLRILADQAKPDVRQQRRRGDEPDRGGEQEGGNEDCVRH